MIYTKKECKDLINYMDGYDLVEESVNGFVFKLKGASDKVFMSWDQIKTIGVDLFEWKE